MSPLASIRLAPSPPPGGPGRAGPRFRLRVAGGERPAAARQPPHVATGQLPGLGALLQPWIGLAAAGSERWKLHPAINHNRGAGRRRRLVNSGQTRSGAALHSVVDSGDQAVRRERIKLGYAGHGPRAPPCPRAHVWAVGGWVADGSLVPVQVPAPPDALCRRHAGAAAENRCLADKIYARSVRETATRHDSQSTTIKTKNKSRERRAALSLSDPSAATTRAMGALPASMGEAPQVRAWAPYPARKERGPSKRPRRNSVRPHGAHKAAPMRGRNNFVKPRRLTTMPVWCLGRPRVNPPAPTTISNPPVLATSLNTHSDATNSKAWSALHMSAPNSTMSWSR